MFFNGQSLDEVLCERARLRNHLMAKATTRAERRKIKRTFDQGDARIQVLYRAHALGLDTSAMEKPSYATVKDR
jgi:hypothetical protein